MTRRRIVSPCDYNQLVEVKTLRECFQSLGYVLCRSDRSCQYQGFRVGPRYGSAVSAILWHGERVFSP